MQQRLWGCDDKPEQPLQLNGEYVSRCPRRPVLDQPDEFRQLFFLYRNYVKGILPFNGSLMDQPAYLMQLFEVIDGAAGLAEKERMKEAERKASKARKGQQAGDPKRARR